MVSPDVGKMFELVSDKHKGQKYGKHNYTYHLTGVMDKAIQIGNPVNKYDHDTMCCVALGHDLLEDTDMTMIQIWEMFTPYIATSIKLLTRPKEHKYILDGTGADPYLDAICEQGYIPYYVKLADALFNYEESIKTLDLRRVKRYSSIIEYLVKNKGEHK